MIFNNLQADLFNSLKLKVENLILHKESQEYLACALTVNGHGIISRKSKVTPKKIGQFVAIWKRDSNGKTAPYSITDNFDYFIIFCQRNEKYGVFIFPKSILLKKGIISSINKEGKRGCRLYPVWDTPNNSTSIKTQKWQLDYFQLLPINTHNKEKLSNIFS